MALELIDSYLPSSTSGFLLQSSGGYQRAGQVFLAPKDFTLSYVIAKLKVSSAITGNASCLIYLITGTPGTNAKPTGSALATSDNFDTSTIGTSYAEGTFTFSGANLINMTKDTWYAIEIYAWLNPGFYVNVKTAGTHAGNALAMLAINSTYYNVPSAYDVYFKIYGNISDRLSSSGARAAMRSRIR